MALGPIIFDIDGTKLSNNDKSILQHPLIGGVIFFARHFDSRQQIQNLIESIRAIRPELLLTVDHEGGRVQRFQSDFTQLASIATLADSPDALRQHATTMVTELQDIDIDFSYAPVLDIDRGHSTVLKDRCFGAEAGQVSQLGQQYLTTMQQLGMASVIKHFPGHGGVTEDSHHDLPRDPRTLAQLLASDLQPFQQAIAAGAKAVMPAHIVFPEVDEQPVAFSRIWLQQILRQQLGFDGVIISDDLSMGAAQTLGTPLHRAQLALAAGCDMILLCNQRQDLLNVLEQLDDDSTPAQQQRRAQLHSTQMSNVS